MDIYDQILMYLRENDNGEYIDISTLNTDLKFLYGKAKELEIKKKISVKGPGFTMNKGAMITNSSNPKKVEAKILLDGHQYLKEQSKEVFVKHEIPKAKKIEYIKKLIIEVRTWTIFERSKVENFIIRAKDVISYIDGKGSNYISEIDIFNEMQIKKSIIDDWVERLLSVLERLKAKVDFEESDIKVLDQNSHVYVSQKRIDEVKALTNEEYDLIKLVQLCKELNDAFQNQNYYSVGMLVRTIINHVPPVFSQLNFASVVSQYKSGGNAKSFKESMEHLENSSRKIADSYVHSLVRQKENLPTDIQVDFRQGLDVLLGEIVRILK